jgi:hypothetical protein
MGIWSSRPCRHSSSYYAELYREHALEGAHVIKLGPGNDEAAREALRAWPGKSQAISSIVLNPRKAICKWEAASRTPMPKDGWMLALPR